MALIDDLLAGRGLQQVDAPGWTVPVFVRRLSTRAILAMQDKPDEAMILAVQDAACDSNGQPLFGNGDDVGRLDLELLKPVAEAALAFSEAPEDAEGE